MCVIGSFLALVLAGATEPPAATESADALKHFQQAGKYSKQQQGEALLVMQGGKVLFEDYAQGWNAQRPHLLASGTKSFTGVAAMLAVQQGLITLDEKVSDTLTEWKSDPRKSQITVRQLLNLSSGLQPDTEDGANMIRAAAGEKRGIAALRALAAAREDYFKQGVEAPAIRDPGKEFRYGGNHYYAFGEFFERRLKERGVKPNTLWEWYTANLFDPIGMKVARIGRDKKDQPQLAGGASVSAQEWAKFGEWVLHKGAVVQADGTSKQLLKPELLAQCFERSPANPQYGLTWWLAGDPAKAPQVFIAAGLGKQRLYVVPEHDLVVVRFAPLNSEKGKFNDQAMLEPILQAIGAKEMEFPPLNPMLNGRKPVLAKTAAASSKSTKNKPVDPEEGMHLIFEDGFNTDGVPDATKWRYEDGFVRNQELQWYRPQNARCEGGLLIIEATHERVPNPNFVAGSTDWRTNREAAEYASASLTTKGTFAFTYGRVKMRGRIQVGDGLWPAFWSVGSARPWPGCGEIDIMENFKGLLLANAAWASDKPGKAQWKDSRTPLDKLARDSGYDSVEAWSKAFHVWQFDWDESRMEFRVDGRLLNTVDLAKTINATPDHANPLQEPQAFIVNLAIGGTSGGDPSNTPFPARFEVDWIRVWQPDAADIDDDTD